MHKIGGFAVKKQKWMKELLGILSTLILSLIVVSAVYFMVIRPVRVDGNSMNPTLNHNDYVLIVPRITDAKYGDVVVLHSHNSANSLYVKRVIATEGQTVDIDRTTGKIIVDGNVLEEDYILEENYTMGNAAFPQTVKSDHIFVLGDNRNNSNDSRFTALGQVDLQDVEGKVLFRIYPADRLGKVS